MYSKDFGPYVMLNNKIPTNVVKFLYYYIRKQPIIFLLISLTAIFLNTANNVIWPYIIGNLVDYFQSIHLGKLEGHIDQISHYFLLALGFWIIIELAQSSKGIALSIAAPKFQSNIISSVFKSISYHSHSYFIYSHVGDIGQRISEMPRSAKFIVDDTLVVFIPLIISVCISSAVVFSMHPILALIFSAWIIIYIFSCIVFCVKSSKEVAVQASSRAFLYGKIVDSISNHLTVKIFTGHNYETQQIQKALNDTTSKYKHSMLYIEKFKILLACISVISVASMFYYAVLLWRDGSITAGDIVFLITNTLALMQYLWWAYDEMPYVFYEIGVLKQSLTLLIDSDHKEDLGSSISVKKGEIEFSNVSFNYKNNNNIFQNKSLIIKGGEKIGLVGFSGSGKTTFANLIMRLYDVSSGSIKVDGQDIAKASLDSVRSSIAFIPQDPFLFHRSVMENIRYGNNSASDEEVIEASKKAECHNFIINLENGYDTIVGERGGKLSGGQRQRIAIARAILKNAQIIVMDEATSALDSSTEKLIERSLNDFMKEKTVIVIAHRLSTLINLDRILVFDKGNIVEDGTHKELLDKNLLYANLWRMQQNGILPEHESQLF